jgi:CheY-like chemotaxis protein
MSTGAPVGQRDPFPADGLVGIHVLVVDDDDDARDLLRAALEYSGALVTAVSSVQKAMDVLARLTPDVVLCDISMPGEDGYGLLRRIRALSSAQAARVPTIAMTAHGPAHGPERTLAVGFDAHLSKPLDPWEIRRTIAALARRGAP